MRESDNRRQRLHALADDGGAEAATIRAPSPADARAAARTGDDQAGAVRMLVVGVGLIGASIALALRRQGTDVLLADCRPRRVAEAVDMAAGRPWPGGPADQYADGGPAEQAPPEHLPADHVQAGHLHVDHVVVAVPPRKVGEVIRTWQRILPDATFGDTASVKTRPLADAEALGCDMTRICGGHPIAGSERSGPGWADPDLFARRPWVLTPDPRTSTLARRHAYLVAAACGGLAVEMDAEAHDRALGLLSHLPHVVAGAVAAQLALASDSVMKLAGPGLWDFTRIAGANADLWSDIVAANAAPVAAALAQVVADLSRVRDGLVSVGRPAAGDENTRPAETVESAVVPPVVPPALDRLLRLGNAGRGRLEATRADVTGLVVNQEGAPRDRLAPDRLGPARQVEVG